MARQVINTGSALGDRTGDNGRVAFTKVNENFAELYTDHVITAAETAAGLTANDLNHGYPPGDIRRYGTNTTPGTTDMRTAIQAAFNQLAEGGAPVVWQRQTHYISGVILLPSNSTARGAGQGLTTIKHPASFAFRNAGYAGTGNDNITIEGFTFDADGTFDGGVSMIGIRGLRVRDCHFKNIKDDSVTVGIGVAATATASAGDISVTGCRFDVPDYGVVIDSDTGSAIEDVRISGNTFSVSWGSGVSCALNVKRVSIVGNTFELLGDLPDLSSDTGVGIGVKLWEGSSLGTAPEDIEIVGNTFVGPTSRTNIQAISIANYASNIVVSGNTFRDCTYALYNNFAGTGAYNIKFSGNVVKDCNNGFYSDTSANVQPTITDNTFNNISGHAIRAAISHGIVSGNKILDVDGKGIYCNSPTTGSNITNNNIRNIGQEAIYFAGSSASNEVCNISDNVIQEVCLSADNTYAVIELNNLNHVVTGNLIRNESTTEKPTYMIGGTGDWRVIVGNWMYGARSGYEETTGANDVYASNVERGGIG